MKKTMLRIVSTACAISLLMGLAGCQKSDTPSQGSGSQGTQEAQ